MFKIPQSHHTIGLFLKDNLSPTFNFQKLPNLVTLYVSDLNCFFLSQFHSVPSRLVKAAFKFWRLAYSLKPINLFNSFYFKRDSLLSKMPHGSRMRLNWSKCVFVNNFGNSFCSKEKGFLTMYYFINYPQRKMANKAKKKEKYWNF